jgi:peptidoglycan hydrolase-like protein with peptidoglycan-binding domain
MPRRRRGARAAAAEAERGLAMRMLLRSPKDMVAGALAFAAVSAIIANALLLQSGHHPAPMFGSVIVMPPPALASAGPLPRPRPAEAAATLSDSRAAEPRVVEARPAERPAEPKPADPLGNLVKATSLTPAAPSNVLRPPSPVPVASRAEAIASAGARRIAAVQRALAENGYGQLKPTGTVGSDTQAAIQKFERERKIPVTGQMSDRLVRELSAAIGHPVE